MTPTHVCVKVDYISQIFIFGVLCSARLNAADRVITFNSGLILFKHMYKCSVRLPQADGMCQKDSVMCGLLFNLFECVWNILFKNNVTCAGGTDRVGSRVGGKSGYLPRAAISGGTKFMTSSFFLKSIYVFSKIKNSYFFWNLIGTWTFGC